MAERSKTVSFSGHRSFKAGGLFARPDADVGEWLAGVLREYARQGYTDFLCGMAEGFDLLAGEAVVALRREFPHIRLVAVLPFPEQGRGFAAEVKERYHAVLNAADSVVAVSPRYAVDCFHLRNNYLVDNSSVLVCYYNGAEGGTRYTVRRALRNNLEIRNYI